jgi:hypothetical protein
VPLSVRAQRALDAVVPAETRQDVWTSLPGLFTLAALFALWTLLAVALMQVPRVAVRGLEHVPGIDRMVQIAAGVLIVVGAAFFYASLVFWVASSAAMAFVMLATHHLPPLEGHIPLHPRP